jgi:hypothetical protein
MPQIKNEAKQKPIRQNRIVQILENIGIQDMKPTDNLLAQLGMSRKRYFQILRNQGQQMNVQESQSLSAWLMQLEAISNELELFQEKVSAEDIQKQFNLAGNV